MKSNVLSMNYTTWKKIQAQVKSLSQAQCENQENMNLKFEMLKIKTKILKITLQSCPPCLLPKQ